MERTETKDVPKQGGTLAFYKCPACGRGAGLIFESVDGMDAEAQGWVEREIAARGSFFPSDYTGRDRGPRGW